MPEPVLTVEETRAAIAAQRLLSSQHATLEEK
jgi:hypothetical protein